MTALVLRPQAALVVVSLLFGVAYLVHTIAHHFSARELAALREQLAANRRDEQSMLRVFEEEMSKMKLALQKANDDPVGGPNTHRKGQASTVFAVELKHVVERAHATIANSSLLSASSGNNRVSAELQRLDWFRPKIVEDGDFARPPTDAAHDTNEEISQPDCDAVTRKVVSLLGKPPGTLYWIMGPTLELYLTDKAKCSVPRHSYPSERLSQNKMNCCDIYLGGWVDKISAALQRMQQHLETRTVTKSPCSDNLVLVGEWHHGDSIPIKLRIFVAAFHREANFAWHHAFDQCSLQQLSQVCNLSPQVSLPKIFDRITTHVGTPIFHTGFRRKSTAPTLGLDGEHLCVWTPKT